VDGRKPENWRNSELKLQRMRRGRHGAAGGATGNKGPEMTKATTSFTKAVMGAVAIACLTASQAAAADLLGNYDAWDAYKSKEAPGVVCYVVAEPTTKEPAAARRDPVFLVINTWPGKGVRQQPNVQIGYPFKEGSTADVSVGADKFTFFTQGENAWLKTIEEETRFVQALRSGAEARIQGTSRRGTLTTDTYVLKGISAALDKADEACK
jgi:hypothetical protein